MWEMWVDIDTNTKIVKHIETEDIHTIERSRQVTPWYKCNKILGDAIGTE